MLNALDDLCTTQSVFSSLKISERSISAENRSTIAHFFCSCSQNSNQVAESDFTSLLAEAEASEKAAQSSYDKLAEQNNHLSKVSMRQNLILNKLVELVMAKNMLNMMKNQALALK